VDCNFVLVGIMRYFQYVLVAPMHFTRYKFSQVMQCGHPWFRDQRRRLGRRPVLLISMLLSGSKRKHYTGRPRTDEIAKCVDSFSQKHTWHWNFCNCQQRQGPKGVHARARVRMTLDSIDSQVQPTLPANLILEYKYIIMNANYYSLVYRKTECWWQ
jgi:hypothetical protein